MEIITQQKSSGELAAASSAALAKATIEAKFVMALQRPRNAMQARSRILEACKRKGFAETSRYSVPRAGQSITGLSIRFAEAALQAWGNVDVGATIAFEDDEKRVLRVTLTDLETNISYTDEVIQSKTVERRKLKDGQVAIGERINSTGEKVYIVAATDEDLMMKANAAKSKSIRTSGLRLIPQDILDEAWDAIDETLRKGGEDPAIQAKKIADGFATIGVQVVDLEAYLGHSLRTCSPKEMADLRGIYTSIKDGESSWGDYTAKADPIPQGATTAPAAAVRAATTKAQTADDDIPMDYSAKEAAPDAPPFRGVQPSTGAASPNQPQASTAIPSQPTAAGASKVSPQDELWALVQGAKGTFENLVAWLTDAGDLDANKLPGDLSEIPDVVCRRWLKAPRLVLRGIEAAKGGVK